MKRIHRIMIGLLMTLPLLSIVGKILGITTSERVTYFIVSIFIFTIVLMLFVCGIWLIAGPEDW